MKKSFSRALAVGSIAAMASIVVASPALAAATVSPTTLTTGLYAIGSAYNPAGDTVAVAAMGSAYLVPPVDSEVDFIDVKTNTVTVVTDAAITSATSLVWSPDGSLVYALNATGSQIAVIDVATHTVVDTIGTGGMDSPYAMAITPDGTRLLIGNYSAFSAVSVIEISSEIVTGLVVNAPYAVGAFVSADGSQAYIVDYYGAVSVFDFTDPAFPLIDTMQFADMDYGGTSVCASFDMSTLYMVDYMETVAPAYVSRLDLASGDSISTTTTAVGESIGCNMTPDGKNLLVASYGGDNPGAVAEFDGATLAAVTTYTTSATDSTDVIASSPKNCDVYVSNYEPSTNILNFPCSPELPNTGVDTAPLAVAGGIALIVLASGTVLVIRRRDL